MKHSGARTYNTGEEWPAGGIQIVQNDPIPIHQGWNLISVYDCPVTAANITTQPSGLISGPIYTYNGGYMIANTLYPGYSYWLKSTADGLLILPDCP